ncbi:MAG: acyl-CoA dehydrogenase family protein, partial [Myxococcota bacterium]|nr:acyl-CoA dehydrogenase family protein [Myxococcota bacterium]
MSDLDGFRQEVRSWLEANYPESMRGQAASADDLEWGGRAAQGRTDDKKVWLDRMGEKGWTCPTWPSEYGGGGLNREEAKVLNQEMSAMGARSALSSFGISMLGPVLLEYATEEQKQKFIPEIVKGKIWWCQGYSEPGSGSDLASLQTRAEDKGDHFL